MQIQDNLCPLWTQCFEGSPTQLYGSKCGRCSIPVPDGVDIAALTRPTFADGNLFGGTSLILIIITASVGGVLGLVLGCCLVRGVAKVGWITTLCTTLVLIVLVAIPAVCTATLPSVLFDHYPIEQSLCSTADIDPVTSGVQRVSAECLQITAAQQAESLFVTDARLSVTGVLANMLIFLVESLTNLSRAIQVRGPTLWAKFEVNVFLIYYLFVAGCLLVLNLLRDGELFTQINEIYANATEFGATISGAFGADFPLTLDVRWPFQRQEAVATGLWYNIHDVVPQLVVVVVVQLVPLIAGCVAPEAWWVNLFRVALIIDTFILITLYTAMSFMAMAAINLVNNIVAILIIPLGVQYLFAILYALQSDIAPLKASLPVSPVLSIMTRFVYILPILCFLGISVGLSYWIFWGFDDGVEPGAPVLVPAETAQEFGLTMIAACGGVLLVMLLIGSCFAIKIVVRYYDDWTQMAADKLAQHYPSTFAKRADEDSEQEDDEADEADVEAVPSAAAPSADALS